MTFLGSSRRRRGRTSCTSSSSSSTSSFSASTWERREWHSRQSFWKISHGVFEESPSPIVIPASPTPDGHSPLADGDVPVCLPTHPPTHPLLTPGGLGAPEVRELSVACDRQALAIRFAERVGPRQRDWPSIIQANRPPCVLGASRGVDWPFKRAPRSLRRAAGPFPLALSRVNPLPIPRNSMA